MRDEIHSKMLMNIDHGEETKKSGIKGKKRVERMMGEDGEGF